MSGSRTTRVYVAGYVDGSYAVVAAGVIALLPLGVVVVWLCDCVVVVVLWQAAHDGLTVRQGWRQHTTAAATARARATA